MDTAYVVTVAISVLIVIYFAWAGWACGREIREIGELYAMRRRREFEEEFAEVQKYRRRAKKLDLELMAIRRRLADLAPAALEPPPCES